MARIISKRTGFTLTELIFALAIVLVLVAVFLPLAVDQLAQSKIARAQADIDTIAAALTNFFSDMDNFPSCNKTDCDPLTDSNNNLRFLAVGTGDGNLQPEYPTDTDQLWKLPTQHANPPSRNNAYNHLVLNNPNGNNFTEEAGEDYRSTKWKSPYIAKLSVDPFGKAYIIHVGAMQKKGCPVGSTGGPPQDCNSPATGRRGWILSAGPDGNLDTSPTATQLSNDDIGYIFCTNC